LRLVRHRCKLRPAKYSYATQIILYLIESKTEKVMTYLGKSRRNFLKTITTTTFLSATPIAPFAIGDSNDTAGSSSEKESLGSESIQNDLPGLYDGPESPMFQSLHVEGNKLLSQIDKSIVSGEMAEAIGSAPTGTGVAWGIPFQITDKVIYLKSEVYQVNVNPFTGQWLVFLHTSDRGQLKQNDHGFYEKPFRGTGLLNEHIASYHIMYEDGTEESLPIRQRYHIGMFQQIWGENCIESVACHKPRPVRFQHQQPDAGVSWGGSQTKVTLEDRGNWINWLWAWENPKPGIKITGFRFEPLNKIPIILSSVSAGTVKTNPLRWDPRQKAILSLPKGVDFLPEINNRGLLSQIKLDLGQVISAVPRLPYPNQSWEQSYNNKVPESPQNDIIIEYAAHPEAMFHFPDQQPIPVARLKNNLTNGFLRPVNTADRIVKIRIVEKGSNIPVPVKFHAHGESDEYLAPDNRHRDPNNAWFEDYSVDFVHQGRHSCTYIPGETTIKLPRGKVFIEVSKGFEIKPLRQVFSISDGTEELTIEIEKALSWRDKGWVTADTHVHFLSPNSALLEGEAEGVNIVNLLASQWGELMTNVGDFDGKTTLGARDAGGKGEYMVRVGTENRQHVLGHISLLGYEGRMITPMTTGGIDESAIGDPIEVLLTEWAQQCKRQHGIVILPHFPNPRLENASAIVSGEIDGVEMTSWGDLYSGINPYSLSDWYRYLNCGYFVAAVGGTDKMSADTAVGTVRTYVKIPDDQEFTYETWKESIRRGHTFVTYGPLVDFLVDGKPAGSQIEMSLNGGTVDITWEVASVTVPMSRVELIVNGEVKESVSVSAWKGAGNWRFKISNSSWIAILVRGHYPDKSEIITAHTSPVMIRVKDSPMLAAADGLTILEQIEGAMAYLETIGTRAEDKAYKRMKMVLTSAHRSIHNRLHEAGMFHSHIPVNDHPDHH